MKKLIIGLIVLSFLAGFIAYVPASVAGSAALAVTSTPVTTSDTDGVISPDQFPDGVNPLTGLPVENPENLLLPPAMVSITNFPVSSRPQAGLSFSPFVFEIYIGEGMTRFLAMFYGDFPQVEEDDGEGVPVPLGALQLLVDEGLEGSKLTLVGHLPALPNQRSEVDEWHLALPRHLDLHEHGEDSETAGSLRRFEEGVGGGQSA